MPASLVGTYRAMAFNNAWANHRLLAACVPGTFESWMMLLRDYGTLRLRDVLEPAISYAASPALARQAESGAPADIFISADLDWMDYIEKRNLVKAGSRTNLLRNELVLIAPADSKASITIGPKFPLAKALGNARLAMADPRTDGYKSLPRPSRPWRNRGRAPAPS